MFPRAALWHIVLSQKLLCCLCCWCRSNVFKLSNLSTRSIGWKWLDFSTHLIYEIHWIKPLPKYVKIWNRASTEHCFRKDIKLCPLTIFRSIFCGGNLSSLRSTLTAWWSVIKKSVGWNSGNNNVILGRSAVPVPQNESEMLSCDKMNLHQLMRHFSFTQKLLVEIGKLNPHLPWLPILIFYLWRLVDTSLWRSDYCSTEVGCCLFRLVWVNWYFRPVAGPTHPLRPYPVLYNQCVFYATRMHDMCDMCECARSHFQF